jgi:hypothetical protein
MAVNLSPVGGAAAQFFTNSGVILSGGKLYTYAAGTTTPAVTYTTSSGSTPRTNPIILDSAGRVPSGGEIWLTQNVSYKFILKDSNEVLIGTYDNIPSSPNTDASLVSYTPAGAGAVTTTVQAKLRQTVSVQDFGAVGDGTTNDYAAWSLAVTYCTANDLELTAPSVNAFYNIGTNLNITCAFQAGLYSVFGGAGVITFAAGSVQSVNPEWWYDGGVDWAPAINSADASIIGPLDGNTLTSKAFVSFMARTYRINSTITYNGSPWRGCGRYATTLDYYGSSYAVDAFINGSYANRKQFSISGMKILGENSSAGAIGLRLGYNIRSPKGCDELEIKSFPNEGILFEGPSQQIAFYNLYIQRCGNVTANKPGIGMTATGLLDAIDFFNPNIEDNGIPGNTIFSGVNFDVPGNARNVNFYGGSIEGNYGAGEVYVSGGSASFYGIYFETSSTVATDSLRLHACVGLVSACKFSGNPSRAILATNIASVTASGNIFSSTVTTDIRAEADAFVNVLAAGNASKFSTQGTGRIVRLGSAPTLYTGNGTTQLLATNASETIISGVQSGDVFLVYATGGVESDLAEFSGAWLVTVRFAPEVFPMGTFVDVDCVISGSNVKIKNLNVTSQSIYWQYAKINGTS